MITQPTIPRKDIYDERAAKGGQSCRSNIPCYFCLRPLPAVEHPLICCSTASRLRTFVRRTAFCLGYFIKIIKPSNFSFVKVQTF